MTTEEHSRMVATYLRLNQIVNSITNLNLGSSLTWVWVWDVIKSTIEREGATVSEDEIFAKLWADVDKEGFTLEYGAEDVSEHITNWLIKNGFIKDEDLEEEEGL